MEYPDWFYYAVDNFYAKSVSEINERLKERCVDANSVISIQECSDKLFHVFYKVKVFS